MMRSLLFVPADAERKLAKGMASGADVLLLDLEDSVAAPRKAAAREMAHAFIAANRAVATRPRIYVRINALDTEYWQADLAAVMPAAPDGIMLPKAAGGDDVHRLSIALSEHESTAGIADGATRILPIATELPIAALNMASFVDASRRLVGLTWGAEDLSAELGSTSTREADGRYTSPYRLARDLTLMAARAGGVEPIDTVFADFRDGEGFAREAREAARDGFTGKMAIHPDQVAVINAAFTPSADAVATAQAIVALFAASPGAGVISHAGRMYDRPHLRLAERLLARVRGV